MFTREKWGKIGVGRQRCVLRPLLFNVYSGQCFLTALESNTNKIKVNGKHINNLRYADDSAILAQSPEGLQRLLEVICKEGDTFGLKINISKEK